MKILKSYKGSRAFTFIVVCMAIFVSFEVGMIWMAVNNTVSNENEVLISRGKALTGLRQASSGVCDGMEYEVVDAQGKINGCSHGPDLAESGMDVTKGVMPLTINTAAADPPILCDGDGVTGYRTEMIYAVSSDKPNRYAQFATNFQVYASSMNNIFVQSGAQSGSTRDIRFVTDVNCKVVVHNETLSPTGDDSVGNSKSELMAKGYNRSDRKYIVWADALVYCGIAYVQGDSRPGQDNASNRTMGFGRIDQGCWSGSVGAHELMHTLGAVQKNSPHSNAAYHCTDEWDRMCYDDGTGTAMTYGCVTAGDDQRFDCNKDDYFNAGTPVAGSYLDTYWNTANSQFLIKNGIITPVVTPPVTPPPPPITDPVPPAVIAPPTPPTSTGPTPPPSIEPKVITPPPPPPPTTVTPPASSTTVTPTIPKAPIVTTKPTNTSSTQRSEQKPTGWTIKIAGKHVTIPLIWLWSGGGAVLFAGAGGLTWWWSRRHKLELFYFKQAISHIFFSIKRFH